MEQLVTFGQRARNTGARIGRTASLLVLVGVAIVVVACGDSSDKITPAPVNDQISETQPAAVPDPTATAKVDQAPASNPTSTVVVEDEEKTPFEATQESDFEEIFSDDAEKARAATLRTLWGWKTNLEQRTVPLTEMKIVLGRDKITPIDSPSFVSVDDAPDYMESREPVVALIVDGEARAYPLAILMWHEIVNDTVGGKPVTVTFCPLCNTGITFSRIVAGQELTFGTSGMLRNSDLVMWDRESESFWQQITGEALVGDFAADKTVLDQLPSSIIAWETFAETYPEGLLLERVFNSSGLPERPYDSPPYAGYDTIDDRPFLFNGTLDDRLRATSRVLTIDGELPVAYPFSFLEEVPVVNDSVDGAEIVAFFDNGTFSAFNTFSNEHQTAGSVAVFSRMVGEESLTFEATDSGIKDAETGTLWNLAGVAVEGELAGTELEPVLHANHFWFAWAVFKPLTEIRDSIGDLVS